MGEYKRIPGDFGVIAMSLEAQERRTSYGKLVAASSLEEREKIVEKWKRRLYGGHKGGRG